jgi:hypothetical protein
MSLDQTPTTTDRILDLVTEANKLLKATSIGGYSTTEQDVHERRAAYIERKRQLLAELSDD